MPIQIAIGGLHPLNYEDYKPHKEKKGVTTYWLREKYGIDRKTIHRLRSNDNIETKTVSKLCSALDCTLEDIAQFIPDKNTD